MEGLKINREKCGLNQNELAVLAGVSQPAISEFETGKKNPRIDTALKLAAALNCTVEQLVGIEPFQPKEPKDE